MANNAVEIGEVICTRLFTRCDNAAPAGAVSSSHYQITAKTPEYRRVLKACY